ncbi:PE domain-containing protein [Mycobacteroides salmoniphilum]|uniref:Putative PE family protein PE35 n=1 Tax=Mycobacteroides salmoniphilum TaxID=404941 RepID=A0A4R8T0Z9_9MYCO|nr:PE domain-containing protein [Mycobacteroides salmoniphilum]TEA09128.1 putative PE family protein PE35 [Mycobacteroides salmoniphilum]
MSMPLMVQDEQLGALGAQLVQNGVQGVTHTTTTMTAATALPPAGADSVSIMGAAAFAAYGMMTTVHDMFGQQCITLLGAEVVDAAAAYKISDAAGAAIVG